MKAPGRQGRGTTQHICRKGESTDMSMYEIAVADGRQLERAAVLIPVLGGPHVARFRDIWAEKGEDGPVIHLYTRTGGGNRACTCDGEPKLTHLPRNCYAAANEALQAHPMYLRDADDELDGTYASFWFRVPGQFREAIAEVAGEAVDTAARWREAIAALERGEVRPAALAMMDQLAAGLADTSPGAPKVIGT